MVSLDFVDVLSFVIGFFSFLLVRRCTDMPIEPEATRKKLIQYFQYAPTIVALLGIFNFNTDKILMLFQKGWWCIGVFSLILACLPPITAYLERRKDPAAADKSYPIKNLGFNLLGVACVGCMLFTLYHEVADFRFLQTIPVVLIISLTIPLCLWVVLSYQSTEQQEQKHNNLNHDASLSRTNQLLNVLHLFNAFFCALTSAAFIFAYTLYCRLSNVELVLDIWYLAAFSILMVFFYACGFHSLPHIRMVCMSNVPAILIASVYWMSWFTVSSKVFFCQSVFIVVHSLIYVTIIYRNMNFYPSDEAGEQMSMRHRLLSAARHPSKTLKKIGQKLVKYQFYIITLVIVTAIYVVFIFIPFLITQQSELSLNLSEKIITAVCEDTDRNADEIFEELKGSKWANQESGRINCVQFSDFIYQVLRPELLEKNIIASDDQSLSYDQLKKWFES